MRYKEIGEILELFKRHKKVDLSGQPSKYILVKAWDDEKLNIRRFMRRGHYWFEIDPKDLTRKEKIAIAKACIATQRPAWIGVFLSVSHFTVSSYLTL